MSDAALILTLIALDPNGETPSWVPLVAFAIPVVIVSAVLVPALRSRRKNKAATRATRSGIKESAVALGSAREISDGASYSLDALRKALAVAPEDHGPRGSEPHNEGWEGEMLGLRSKVGTSVTVLEPNLSWGKRDGRQVFVRVGPDEKIAGGTTMMSNRHVRQITVLRVATSECMLDVVDGLPRLVAGNLDGLDRVLARMQPNDAIWQDLAVQCGSEGLVATRGAVNTPGFWIYDLWLLEAIASELSLDPLADARIGPAWKIPYELGRKFIALP